MSAAVAEAPPVTVPVPDVEGTSIKATELSRLLRNAVPFAADDWTLPALNAVHLSASGTQLTVAATDRYKLLRERFTLDEPAEWTVLLHLGDIRDLLQLIQMAGRGQTKFTRDQMTVRLEVADKLTVTVATYSATFNPVLGKFPDYDRLIPASAEAGASPVSLGLQHLGAFAALKSGLGSTPGRFTVVDRAKPVRFDLGDNITGLLMPVLEAKS
jgi:DNA polymerase III sliding clamp (beta) subunit (PCNA family)